MAVVGFAHPDEIWTNAGARAGDVLAFSKRIGTGIVATAVKRGDPPAEVVAAAVEPDDDAQRPRRGRSCASTTPHAVTDVTGFGLVGHTRELAAAAGLQAAAALRRACRCCPVCGS